MPGKVSGGFLTTDGV